MFTLSNINFCFLHAASISQLLQIKNKYELKYCISIGFLLVLKTIHTHEFSKVEMQNRDNNTCKQKSRQQI